MEPCLPEQTGLSVYEGYTLYDGVRRGKDRRVQCNGHWLDVDWEWLYQVVHDIPPPLDPPFSEASQNKWLGIFQCGSQWRHEALPMLLEMRAAVHNSAKRYTEALMDCKWAVGDALRVIEDAVTDLDKIIAACRESYVFLFDHEKMAGEFPEYRELIEARKTQTWRESLDWVRKLPHIREQESWAETRIRDCERLCRRAEADYRKWLKLRRPE